MTSPSARTFDLGVAREPQDPLAPLRARIAAWLMIRPSGTEPKVRFYIEARTEEGKKAVFETAEQMTKEALGM